MAIETYTRKPRGFSHHITKYRVRIRSHLDDDTPVKIDELYDTLAEAKAAEEKHWLSIRTGALSNVLEARLWRLREPSIEFLLETYAKYETPKRAESARKVEKTRLEKTIPNVKVYVGKPDKLEQRLKPNAPSENGVARIGDVIAAACTRQIILDYIRIRSKTVGPATVRREIGLLSSAFDAYPDYWSERPRIENPCKELRQGQRPSLPKHRERVLSETEQKTMLRRADALQNGELALGLRLALGSAMRRGDILSLDWSHVDWENHIVAIPEDKATRLGRRRTGRKALLLPLAYEALRSHWESVKKPRAGKVFGLKMLGFKSAWERLQEKLEKEDGIADLHFHDLRHTAITRAAASGWSPVQVAAAFDVADLEHLEKRHFDNKTEKAKKALLKGETLTLDELAAVGGHLDKNMVARYANLKPEDAPKENTPSKAQSVIEVREDGAGGYLALVGDVQIRASTLAKAYAMAKELLAQ